MGARPFEGRRRPCSSWGPPLTLRVRGSNPWIINSVDFETVVPEIVGATALVVTASFRAAKSGPLLVDIVHMASPIGLSVLSRTRAWLEAQFAVGLPIP